MEPTSMVSFNNDSTYQANLKSDFSDTEALELALHTMRDRCLILQRRIHSLENDNMRLKLNGIKTNENYINSSIKIDEDGKKMFEKVAELTKQKSQLTHHVFMVTCENKNLWSRIASLTRQNKPNNTNLVSERNEQPQKQNNRLLRSETFTHGAASQVTCKDDYSEASLEEISLKLINSFLQEKSDLVEQYEQMAELQALDDSKFNLDSIGFTYYEDQNSESLNHLKIHTDKMLQLKSEVLQQESELEKIINQLETIKNKAHQCCDCKLKEVKQNKAGKMERLKESDTTDSLTKWATPANSTSFTDNNIELPSPSTITRKCSNGIITQPNMEHTSELQEAAVDKMCPMCGQYFKSVNFTEFQQHVMNHFVGDLDPDSIIDSYELVINSVDNNFK